MVILRVNNEIGGWYGGRQQVCRIQEDLVVFSALNHLLVNLVVVDEHVEAVNLCRYDWVVELSALDLYQSPLDAVRSHGIVVDDDSIVDDLGACDTHAGARAAIISRRVVHVLGSIADNVPGRYFNLYFASALRRHSGQGSKPDDQSVGRVLGSQRVARGRERYTRFGQNFRLNRDGRQRGGPLTDLAELVTEVTHIDRSKDLPREGGAEVCDFNRD